jgi:hypothetical protein
MGYLLGCDVSKWQEKVNYALLKANGVEVLIAKATQGIYGVDRMFLTHVNGAKAAGMKVGAYHWADPTLQDKPQLDLFTKTVEPLLKGKIVDFLAIDTEQYWQDWGEWSANRITKIISPNRIAANTAFLYEGAGKLAPTMDYTRISFMKQYAPSLLPMKWNWWLAQYPFRGVVACNWDSFRTVHLPMYDSIIGPQADWIIWQFAGDRYKLLDGSALDLDFVDPVKFNKFLGITDTTPKPLTLEERIKRLESIHNL